MAQVDFGSFSDLKPLRYHQRMEVKPGTTKAQYILTVSSKLTEWLCLTIEYVAEKWRIGTKVGLKTYGTTYYINSFLMDCAKLKCYSRC